MNFSGGGRLFGPKIILIVLAAAVWLPPAVAAETPLPAASAPIWSVREAVRVALASSPDSKVALARLEAAQAAIMAEKAAFYPRLSLQSQYSQTTGPMYSFGNILNQGGFDRAIDFNHPGRTDSMRFAVQLDYVLYNGGRDRAELEVAEAQRQVAEIEAAVVRAQLAFAVVRSFHLALQAEDLVRAHESAVESAVETLAVATFRYEAGTFLRSDLLDLEVQLSRAREDLIRARHGLEVGRRILLNLLGVTAETVILARPDGQEQEAPTTGDAGQRPELRVMTARVSAAELLLRRARAGRYPSLEGVAGYELERGSVLGGSGDSWQAGVRLRYDIFDGYQVSAEVLRAQALLAEALEQKRKIELEIGLDIEQARFSLQEADQRLAVTGNMVEQARESAAINRARFKEGVVLAADLLAAENRLTDVTISRSQAEAFRRIAIAGLRRALGLPQFSGVDDEVP